MLNRRLIQVLLMFHILLSAYTGGLCQVGSHGASMNKNNQNDVKEIKVLIAYQSKYGSTKQYAEWIQKEANGDLVNIESGDKPDLARYDVMVIGGYVRAGKIVIAPFIEEHWHILKEKKVVLFTTSGTPPRHPKIQSIYEDSLSAEIRKEIKYFPLHGRISGKNLTLFDQFLIAVGKIIEQDETLKKDMGKDFDGVQRENLLPLFEYLQGVKTMLTSKKSAW